MAGTGKSQVIKALMNFLHPEMNLTDLLFWHPQELQQALLHGSTYHSILGVPLMVKQR